MGFSFLSKFKYDDYEESGLIMVYAFEQRFFVFLSIFSLTKEVRRKGIARKGSGRKEGGGGKKENWKK